MNIQCNYIGICCPDYLTDHHNRENELLILASANAENSNSLINELISDAMSSVRIPNSITDEQIKEAIIDCFKDFMFGRDMATGDTDFQYDEDVYVYAYLSWEKEND